MDTELREAVRNFQVAPSTESAIELLVAIRRSGNPVAQLGDPIYLVGEPAGALNQAFLLGPFDQIRIGRAGYTDIVGVMDTDIEDFGRAGRQHWLAEFTTSRRVGWQYGGPPDSRADFLEIQRASHPAMIIDRPVKQRQHLIQPRDFSFTSSILRTCDLIAERERNALFYAITQRNRLDLVQRYIVLDLDIEKELDDRFKVEIYRSGTLLRTVNTQYIYTDPYYSAGTMMPDGQTITDRSTALLFASDSSEKDLYLPEENFVLRTIRLLPYRPVSGNDWLETGDGIPSEDRMVQEGITERISTELLLERGGRVGETYPWPNSFVITGCVPTEAQHCRELRI
jgi:hypothetical protein